MPYIHIKISVRGVIFLSFHVNFFFFQNFRCWPKIQLALPIIYSIFLVSYTKLIQRSSYLQCLVYTDNTYQFFVNDTRYAPSLFLYQLQTIEVILKIIITIEILWHRPPLRKIFGKRLIMHIDSTIIYIDQRKWLCI